MNGKFIPGTIFIVLINYLIAYIVFVSLNKGYFFYLGISSILSTVLLLFIYFRLIKPGDVSRQELEKTELMRREFVANVSHEFKTPLTSISGFVETLQGGAQDDPEVRSKFLDIIAIESSRLNRLIDDLLTISDIENRKAINIPESFDIKDSLEHVVEAMKPIASRENIKLVLDCEDNLILKGDEDRFRQMLMNLMENGIKYSDRDKTVNVRAFRQQDSVVVSVRDQGIGIAEKDIPRLFERFYRADKSRTEKVGERTGGTGLGLSIVKHIASLFEATIEVESILGEGSEFIISFPHK